MVLRILLFLLLVLLGASNLGVNDIWQPNEAFYAETAREILEKGNWLDLTYNYEPRLEKPPLTYWLTAISYTLFGINEFATRLVPLLSGLGTALLTLFYGRYLFGWRFGLLAAIALFASTQFFSLLRYDAPEMPLLFFLTGAFIFLHLYLDGKKLFFLLLSGVFLALALLTKGIPFLFLYWGIAVLYLLAKVFLKEETLKGSLKTFFPVLGVGTLSAIPVLGWYYYAYTHYGELFIKVFQSEVIHRAFNPQKGWNWSFYLVVILWAFLPLSVHFYYSLIGFLFRLRENRKLLFPFVWFVGVLGAFTLAKGKIPVYILPAFPAMALLVSRLDNKKHPALAGLNYFNLLIFVPLAGGVLYFFNFLSATSFLAVFLLSLAVFFLLSKWDMLKNIILIVPLYHFFVFSLLPWVEKYRPYKEILTELKTSYGNKKLVTLGYFFKDFPFYWGKKVYQIRKLEDLKRFNPNEVLLFSQKPLKGWKVVKKVELYTGSESRFFVFLRDIKEHRRFKTFYFMVKK